MAGSIIRPDESSVSLTELAHAVSPLILLLKSQTQCGAHLDGHNSVETLAIRNWTVENYLHQYVIVASSGFVLSPDCGCDRMWGWQTFDTTSARSHGSSPGAEAEVMTAAKRKKWETDGWLIKTFYGDSWGRRPGPLHAPSWYNVPVLCSVPGDLKGDEFRAKFVSTLYKDKQIELTSDPFLSLSLARSRQLLKSLEFSSLQSSSSPRVGWALCTPTFLLLF